MRLHGWRLGGRGLLLESCLQKKAPGLRGLGREPELAALRFSAVRGRVGCMRRAGRDG